MRFNNIYIYIYIYIYRERERERERARDNTTDATLRECSVGFDYDL